MKRSTPLSSIAVASSSLKTRIASEDTFVSGGPKAVLKEIQKYNWLEETWIDRREESAMKLTFCGNDCSVCPRYVATQSGDIKQLKKVAVLWYKAGYRDRVLPPEELICHGCSSTMCNREDRRVLRECAVRKSVENCGRCEEYPCKRASDVFEQTELAAKDIKERCSKQEYECLQKAFFSRKKNLDEANKEWRLRRKTQRAKFVRQEGRQ